MRISSAIQICFSGVQKQEAYAATRRKPLEREIKGFEENGCTTSCRAIRHENPLVKI